LFFNIKSFKYYGSLFFIAAKTISIVAILNRTKENLAQNWLLNYISDFGNKFDIRQIRVKSVTSRPQPQFVKLDYWDDEFGSGDWQRYIDMSGSDNIGNGYLT